MKQVTVLIVDDETPALKRLEMLLQDDTDFVLRASCTNPEEALNILLTQPIDLLLLDIEMPGLTGLQLLNKLQGKSKPVVVFVTAYDEYAVQAFEYYAIDYILKPFTNDRFKKMLLRVKEHFIAHAKNNISWPEVTKSIEQGIIPNRITVKTGRKYHFINPPDIAYVCANGNYCEIYLENGEKHVHRDTLAHIISILPPVDFIRIHHSYVVALRLIDQVKKLSFGDMEIKMAGGTWLKVSRKYKQPVKKLIKD